ncbi:MAG: hypothetical protein ACLFVT_08345, partial [Syntrophobacteria bacterium]
MVIPMVEAFAVGCVRSGSGCFEQVIGPLSVVRCTKIFIDPARVSADWSFLWERLSSRDTFPLSWGCQSRLE